MLLVILSLCFGCACNKKKDEPVQEPVPGPSTTPTTLSEQNNDFAFRLYGLADTAGKNLFYSPYSITSALSMCYAGAEGNTEAEMAKAMSFNLPEKEQHKEYLALQQKLNAIGEGGKAKMSVANALFGAEKNKHLLRDDYLNLLRESYLSDLYSLDFSDYKGTADYINNWVEEKTNKRIKNLISEDNIRDSNDGLVLVNAIYFKGNWLKQFDPKRTTKDDFFTSSTLRDKDHTKPVEMMSIKDYFAYGKLPGYQLLELPYAEQDLAMFFVLPDEIESVGKSLDNNTFNAWQKALKVQEVQAYIPKFKLDISLEGLSKMLKSMGMKDAFDPYAADFTGMQNVSKENGLFILDVIHKAFVEVNEEGTEAAAATGVVMATKAAPGPDETPVFRADKPFLYMILHKPTNTVLFLGKLTTPPELK
jgi:serpin B